VCSSFSSSRLICSMARLPRVGRRHLSAGVEQIEEGEKGAGRELGRFAEAKVSRLGLKHPERDLQRLSIGMPYRDGLSGLAWPRSDLKRRVMQRVEMHARDRGGQGTLRRPAGNRAGDAQESRSERRPKPGSGGGKTSGRPAGGCGPLATVARQGWKGEVPCGPASLCYPYT